MTPLPVITDTYRCALNWHDAGAGQTATNVIHIRSAGSDAAGVAAAIDARATVTMWWTVSSAAGVDNISVTPLDGSSSSLVYTPTSGHFVGDTAGEMAPQVAPVISFKTAKRGRSYRGRLYLPFTAEAAIANGQMSGTAQTGLLAAWNAFKTGMSSDGFPLVIASYKHATAEAVTNLAVLAAVGTQRRRQTRVRYP